MTDERSGSELAAELEDLRARLAEAEEVLRAIRDGEVDALMVTGDRGEQVYTLTGADRTYRQLVETMSEGAVTVSANGVILYCNVRLAEMLGRPLDQVMGTALRDYLPPADQQALDSILVQVGTVPSRQELNLKSSDGRLVPLYLSASRLRREGAEPVICLVLTDLTEQKHHENIVAEERLARLILEQAAEAIVVCDEQGKVIRASQAAQLFCHGSPISRPFAEVFPLRTYAPPTFQLASVLGGETLRGVEVVLDRPGQALDLLLTAGPLDSGQRILGCVVHLTDITERKRMEKALGASEKRFRTYLDSTTDFVYLEDSQHRMMFVNKAQMASLGKTESEILGKTVFDLLPEPVAVQCDATDRLALESGRVLVSEEVLYDRVFETLKFPVDLGNGTTGVGGFLRDITDRKRAESALRDSEERFRRAVVESPFPIMLHAEDGTILLVSKSWCDITGYDPEELPTMVDWTERAYGKRKSLAQVDIDALYGMTQRTHGGDSVIRTKSGDSRIWDFSSSPLGRLPDGRRLVISMAMDVTERRKAEQDLQESKQLMESIVENVPLMIFLKEAQDLRFVVFNRAGEELLGYARKDLLGKNDLDLFPPEQAAFFMAKDREVLAGNVLLDIPEEPILTAKKGQRLLRTKKVCIKGADGVTKYLLGISEDITERKRMESERQNLEGQLQASQKMEAIGSLAGGVAHDFNNLLSVILSYTAFAMEAVRDGDPLKNDLLEVKKAGERAAALTRQLLAFSRKQVLQSVALDLNQIAAGVEKMLRRILGEDIDLVQTLAPDLGLTLADPGQIEQVLMNLVVNARDAMPQGGKLTIETSNVEIDEEYAARHVAVKPGSYVQLAVSDTGCGMDEHTRARIFEPFFTTKEKGKGTGLGLSTVYGIVKQSGGNIWVYSELGQGTTFKIYLPRELSATAATAIKPVTITTQSRGTETILVVEDEEALRKVARRTLEAAGYKVLTAADGAEALLKSAQHAGDIQLLLTDVVMPGMGGRVLAQQLAKTRPTVKVVYMSGYTDNAIVHHGVLDAGTHFLAKPFISADLTLKVREVLDESTNRVAGGREPAAKDGAEVKEEQPLDKAALRGLPQELLGKLLWAVTAARYDEIALLIETVRTTEPEVAAGLRRMADLFDYDGLRSILGQGKEE